MLFGKGYSANMRIFSMSLPPNNIIWHWVLDKDALIPCCSRVLFSPYPLTESKETNKTWASLVMRGEKSWISVSSFPPSVNWVFLSFPSPNLLIFIFLISWSAALASLRVLTQQKSFFPPFEWFLWRRINVCFIVTHLNKLWSDEAQNLIAFTWAE